MSIFHLDDELLELDEVEVPCGVVGLAETLLAHGQVRGSRQNQASLCHFLWLVQQFEGTEGFVPPPLPPPRPPRPRPRPRPPLLGFVTAATSAWLAAEPLKSFMAAMPALTSVTLVDRNTLSADSKTSW